MLDFWVKFKEIKLYVEHKVDNPIIVDKIFLLTTREGDVEGVEVDGEGDDEGVESDGEGDLEKVESGREGEVGEVQADGEGVSATDIEVDEDIVMESGGHISLGSIVGEDNDSEVTVDEYTDDFATSDGVDNVADEYVGDFTTSDGLDNVAAVRSGGEEDENKTEVWDSDKHGSLVGSDEGEEHEDGEKRRSKFPLYNDKLKFSLGMLFKDGKQFKSRIRASYSPVAKCLQKMFQDEYHCSVSFKNKMVTVAMISQHFEATIKDYLKMKLREIQRRCAFEMHVNVTIDCCYRAKKIVKEEMAGNHKEKHNKNGCSKGDSKLPSSFYELLEETQITKYSLLHGLWLKWSLLIHGPGFSVSYQLIWAWKMGMGRQLSVTNKRLRIQIAISDILPKVRHRNCVRNVFANWSRRKLGKSYECDFWQIVMYTTERE
ncbi:hypothetical protein Gogos_021378 [Gossypium gossypioides]|uniref:Transposase MuDR plant domain-containing protein n=1 Tax=Gossypium gossypioides TaxID=34282 RepID=A0A7J9CZK0_GOSGO|nr:hypothetical protein [Gossypium gossypioides]